MSAKRSIRTIFGFNKQNLSSIDRQYHLLPSCRLGIIAPVTVVVNNNRSIWLKLYIFVSHVIIIMTCMKSSQQYSYNGSIRKWIIPCKKQKVASYSTIPSTLSIITSYSNLIDSAEYHRVCVCRPFAYTNPIRYIKIILTESPS